MVGILMLAWVVRVEAAQVDVLDRIDELTRLPLLTPWAVEKVLGARLLRSTEAWNYGERVGDADGFTRVGLQQRNGTPHTFNRLVLEVPTLPCVTEDQLRARYGAVGVIPSPHGRSPGPQPLRAQGFERGDLYFKLDMMTECLVRVTLSLDHPGAAFDEFRTMR